MATTRASNCHRNPPTTLSSSLHRGGKTGWNFGLENQTTRRILPVASATALAVAFTVSLPQAAHAEVTPPPVPTNIQVPPGNNAFLEGHGVGTQNYVCLPVPDTKTKPAASTPDFAWTLFTPEATLFDDGATQLTTHFFGPNPIENGTIRAAWEHSLDTSTVWGQVSASSTDTSFVASGAIPWLLVQVVGAQDGPTGGNALTATTFIQRLNTSGGVAPSTGCSRLTDVGKKAFVRYTADYFFYTNS